MHLEFILATPTDLTFKVSLEDPLSINEEALGRSKKRHLNSFQFNESVMNTGPIHYLKAYIIKFQSDFSKLFVLAPFLSKLLKFHLLILKPFSLNFHSFPPFR